MALVSVVFTYTIPAQCGETVPPAAPVRCGCDNLILLLEDPALLTSASHGILEATVREVLVSRQPVDYVDPANGSSSKVWKYDYTIEYNDSFFVNPAYKLRRCDIKYNCCRGCAQEYTDRKLSGFVQSISGACVNNVDPSHPVINGVAITGNIVNQASPCSFNINQTLTRLERSGTSLLYTDENAAVSNIGICTIVQQCIDIGVIHYCNTPEAAATFNQCAQSATPQLTAGCGIIVENGQVRVNISGNANSWGYPCDQVQGSEIYCVGGASLRGEPRHTSRAPTASSVSSGPEIANLVAAGDSRSVEITQSFTNPSVCRNMSVAVEGLARSYGFLENSSGPIHMQILIEVDSGGGYQPTNQYNVRKSTDTTLSNWVFDMVANYTANITIGPGITIVAKCRVSVTKLGGTGVYNFDSSGINAGVRLFGVTQ